MPYSSTSEIPEYIPEHQRERWMAVWNHVYNACIEEGEKSRDECERTAFAAANALLSNRSASVKVGDFVVWKNDNGVPQRGCVIDYAIKDAETMITVDRYKPERDGWIATGNTVELPLNGCTKCEALPAPSRVTSKAEEAALTTKSASLAVKRLGEQVIGGYAMRWGTPEERDVEGDFFTKNTDLWLDTYGNQPIFFDHAAGIKVPGATDEDTPRRYRLGSITKAQKDDVGLWIEAVVDAHNDWVEGVWQLIDKGALYFSSGSAPHLIKRAESGEVKSWPIIEVSVTPTPAEPRDTRVSAIRSTEDATPEGEASTGNLRHTAEANSASITPGETHSGGAAQNALSIKNTHLQGITMGSAKQRKLHSLLTGFWTPELANASAAYIKAARGVKQDELPEPEDAEAVTEAASQLEQMIDPIAEQAKSALGLDKGTVSKSLIKMALERIKRAYSKGDPMDEDFMEEGELPEEDFVEEGELPEEDFMEEGELPEDEASILAEYGLDDAPDSDYMEEGELPEDEEVPAMLSSRRKNSRVRAQRNTSFDRLPAPSYGLQVKSTKGYGGMLRSGLGEPAVGLTSFLKSVRDKETAKLNRFSLRSNSSYKALGINPDTAGGYLVPPEHADQIIELLRNASLFMKPDSGDAKLASKITTLPLNTDVMYLPRQTGASTAYWTAENATITASEQTVGQIQLVAKKLACMVKVSNELINDSSHDVDAFIRSDIAQVMAREVDRAILYGQGNNGEPLGVDATPSVSKTALNAAPTYANLVDLPKIVAQNNVPEDDSWSWVINPRDAFLLRNLKDGANQFIFAGNALQAAELGLPNLLLGFPFYSSSVVDRAGSGATEETDIFFGRWRDVVLAMRQTIEVKVSDVAGASFETDQVFIRAILRMDVAMRHPESIAMLTDVRPVT